MVSQRLITCLLLVVVLEAIPVLLHVPVAAAVLVA
jgi:hypothetical protein